MPLSPNKHLSRIVAILQVGLVLGCLGPSLDAATVPSVVSVTLMAADATTPGKNIPIPGFDPIANGAQINRSSLPTQSLSIRANVGPLTSSVRLALDGKSHLDGAGPIFSMCGDSDTKLTYTPCSNLGVGPHTLTATPYSKTNGGGTTGNSYSISFTITNGAPPPSQTASPAFSPPGGTYTRAQSVRLSDTTPGAIIYFTIDGSAPTKSSNLYSSSSPILVSNSGTLKAFATSSGNSDSGLASAAYTVQTNTGPLAIDYENGFTSTGLTLNGVASVMGTRLQITNGASNEAGSAFYSTPVNVGGFTTQFTFQNTKATADGFTFTIQGSGPHALGSTGGGLGFQNIARSVAVKFDIYNSAGEGTSSTGLYLNGARPTVPATNLLSHGINLRSSDTFQVQLSYDGATLTLTITDTNNSNTFTTAFPVDIPGTVGATAAYAGFTGGSGGATAIQQIVQWTFSDSSIPATTAAPTFSPVGGTYTNAQTVMLSDSTTGAIIYYTTDGSTPTISSPRFSTVIPVDNSETINAFAQASNASPSAAVSASYIIQPPPPPPAGAPTFSPAGGTYTGAQTVTLSDTTTGAIVYCTTDGSVPITSSPQCPTVSVVSSETINAIAQASGGSPSAVASATYTIQSTPPTQTASPTFTPAGGTYADAQTVTLSDATTGAIVYCTTDGSAPTTSSPQCPTVSVASSETINAIAQVPGDSPSAVASATYAIQSTPPATSRLLYAVNEVSGSRGSVSVYDMDAGHQLVKTIQTVSGINDLRGAVASAATGKLFVSYINASNVSMIYCLDLYTEAIVWNVSISPGVDRLAVSPDGQLLYVPTGEDNTANFINVVDANSGSVIRTVQVGTHSHDSQYPLSGPLFQETRATDGTGQYLYMIDPTSYAVTKIGPYSGVTGPFGVDSTSTYAVDNVTAVWGFQVANLTTGQIATGTVPTANHPSGSAGLLHGIGWTPDQTEVWLNSLTTDPRVFVFDMTNPMSPVYKQALSLKSGRGSHWLTFNIKGDYGYISPDKNSTNGTEVFNVSTHTSAAVIGSSEEMIEVDFTNSKITQVGDQFGIGRAGH